MTDAMLSKEVLDAAQAAVDAAAAVEEKQRAFGFARRQYDKDSTAENEAALNIAREERLSAIAAYDTAKEARDKVLKAAHQENIANGFYQD